MQSVPTSSSPLLSPAAATALSPAVSPDARPDARPAVSTDGEVDAEAHSEVRAEAHATRDRAASRGVMLIGLFKFSKAIFFTCLGLAALRMVHRSLGDLVLHLTDVLPVDPEGRLVSLLMDKADLIGSHQLREFSLGTIGYAVVCLVEGTGLLLQKSWAEYFTVLLTTLALPWELFELARRPSWFRLGLLLVNLAVLGYLVWILKRTRRRMHLAG